MAIFHSQKPSNEEPDPSELIRLEGFRKQNRKYFDDFLKMHQQTLCNEKAWVEDEISVKWSQFFVTITLHGYDSCSMIVETSSQWPKFKTDLEMGYENMLKLRMDARKKATTSKEKAKYLDWKRKMFGESLKDSSRSS